MNLIKTLVIIVLITAGVFVGLRLLSPEDNWICVDGAWTQHGKPSSPMPITPCDIPKTSPNESSTKDNSTLKEYKNTQLGFSVKLPSDIDTAENIDGSVSFTKWGPTQKTATELYDGISINIVQGIIGLNKDLKSVIEADIEQKKQQLFPDFSILKNITQINNGYYLKSSEMFGEVEYYYLSQSDEKFLLISVIQRDPGNLGFEKIVSDTISSIIMIN